MLEFDLVRERLARYTSYSPAMELAHSLVPSYDSAEVSRRQEETLEARRFLDDGRVPDLAEARDLRGPLQRAALGGVLTGEELRDLHDTLKTTQATRGAVLRGKDIPVLRGIAQGLPVLQDLERGIAGAIGRSGEVLDTASPALKELRTEARSAHQRLQEALEKTVRRVQRHNVLQEPIITQRNGRMVLLLKTEMKQRLPGIVHDVSDSGATLFVEPTSAIDLGNLWRELSLAQGREEERVMRALSAKVETHSSHLLRGLDLLTELDLAFAKGRYAHAIRGTSPTLIESERPYISLSDARHPLLEKGAVPISLKIGDESPVLLVTGPNAGGKTVALKTLGLITMMAQAGLHVPAQEAALTLFDGVYSDIGDQQSIQRSLSTFSSHVQNLRAVLELVTEKSLVLVDELGTSTDPEEGAALAKAILLYFAQGGITLMATTHQREVSSFAQEQPGMVNASVELDPETLTPTYRLTLGLPGRSYALTIAARLGLAQDIIDNAEALRSPEHRRTEGLLKELQEERHLAGEKRREAEEALAQADKRSAELEEQLASIEDRKSVILEEAGHQFRQRVEDIAKRLRAAERALEEPPPRPVEPDWTPEPVLPAPASGPADQVQESPIPESAVGEWSEEEPKPVAGPSVREARKEVDRIRRELRSRDWQPAPSRRSDWLKGLRAGDRVYLRGVPRPVEVIRPPDEAGSVEVLLGTMRARLPVHQIARPALTEAGPPRDTVYYSRSSKGPVDPELNLRGARVEDAIDRIEIWLSDAVQAGLSSVRIFHGVGTGALRSAIREHLSHHPLVKAAGRDENITADSATVVELV